MCPNSGLLLLDESLGELIILTETSPVSAEHSSAWESLSRLDSKHGNSLDHPAVPRRRSSSARISWALASVIS